MTDANARYSIRPGSSGSSGRNLPRGPPVPDPSNPDVVRFSGASVRNCTVINHTNNPIAHFRSAHGAHLEMVDAANNPIGRYLVGKVFYGASAPIKEKKFIKRGASGYTGAVCFFLGQEYEIVQELFYAFVRSVPQCERVAVIYNYGGKLAVEMVNSGAQNPILQTFIVFTIALIESGVTRT